MNLPVPSGTVMVSNDFADDAAVVRFNADDDRAIVFTADVISPLVDEAEPFGAIAATNSVSDIYAMGGRPLFALNLAFFPDDELPLGVLGSIMRGGMRACRDMGVAIVGGHTVRDSHIKYGLAVIGEVKADRVLSNRGALPGQTLVLTKALGTGVLGTAIKKQLASHDEATAAVASMTASNGDALAVAQEYRVTACTDVTGFGLLGHLRNIVIGSGVDAIVDMAQLPLLPGALEHARAGRIPGGSRANLEFLQPILRTTGVEDDLLTLLAADAQTSGGLLLCVDSADGEALTEALRQRGMPARVVGRLSERAAGDGEIELRY